MLYVTGDTHGVLERFKTREAKRLKKNDMLIVCGDFGFLWDGSAQEQKNIQWLGKRRYKILFLEGTHDNLDLLERYPQEDWNGGKVRHLGGNLYQLVRGSVFDLDGVSVFAMGGGESDDLEIREEGVTWWPREMPSDKEIEAARQNLAARENRVDVIVTHESSFRMRSFIDMDAQRVTPLGSFLTEVEKTCQFTRWYFGSYHLDKQIPPRHRAVYRDILPIK